MLGKLWGLGSYYACGALESEGDRGRHDMDIFNTVTHFGRGLLHNVLVGMEIQYLRAGVCG